MSNLSSRLDKLEGKHPPCLGVCACGRKRLTIIEPWETMPAATPPEICPDCGLPIPADSVRFVEVADWRGWHE